MKVLISINQKGGVGKTTTAANVGFRLSQLGKKVLLIDGDEQANLSLIFNATKHKETLFKLFITGEAVKPYEINPNLYIIPSDVRTSNINVQLANDVNAPFFLKKYLAMPALDAIIINAITAGDAMLISLSPGEFSYDGMRRILSASNTIKKNYGAKIQLGGIILSMINARTKVYQQTVELLRADDLLPDAFNTNIRLCEAFKQAEAEHKTIFEFAPKSKGADDMSALTDEIIAKLLQ